MSRSDAEGSLGATSRWQEAKDAEERHYFERSNLRITPRDRTEEILAHWNTDFSSVVGESVLAVGGGAGIIHQLDAAERQVSLDPLNDTLYPEFAAETDVAGLVGMGESLPFPDDSFDTVISANVIDHTADPAETLTEIGRVLDPDGRFLFDVNAFDTPKPLRDLADYVDRPHPHHFGSLDVQRLLIDVFDEVTLTDIKEIPSSASPSLLGRTKIFFANTVFGLHKVYYVCRSPTI